MKKESRSEIIKIQPGEQEEDDRVWRPGRSWQEIKWKQIPDGDFLTKENNHKASDPSMKQMNKY